MNYIELGIYILAGLALLLGIILGLARGSRRSALRLLLILMCIAAAFAIKSTATNQIFALDASTVGLGSESMTIEAYIREQLATQLPEEMQSLTDSLIIPLAKSIVSVVVFLLLFVALRLVSWLIIFPICKIFVKPKRVTKPDGTVVRQKNALIGGAVGLVQGVAIALCICVPLVGLVLETNTALELAKKVESISNSTTVQTAYVQDGDVFADVNASGDASGSSGSQSSSSSSQIDQIIPQEYQQMLSEFTGTNAAKFFGETCKPIFDAVSKVEVETTDENGNVVKKEFVLSEQVGAVEKMVKVAETVTQDPDRINKISEQVQAIAKSKNPVQGIKTLTGQDSDLRQMFKELDEATGDLTPEQAETINNVISSVVDSVEIPAENEQAQAVVDSFKEALKQTDLSTVEFEKELDIVDSLVSIAEPVVDENGQTQEITQEQISEVINQAAQSTLILPVLETVVEDENVNLNVNLDEETKAQVEKALDELPEDTDQKTVDTIKALLGLTQKEPTEQQPEEETEETEQQ